MYKIILIDLSMDPETSAENVYHKLRRLPLDFRQKLEMIVEELPLTKPLEDSRFNISSMNDNGD